MQKKNIIQNLLLFLAAGLIFYVSIMSYGLGITDDSVNYLSAASSFPSMVKIDGTPYVEWPPLYPSILNLYKLTGLNILNFTAVLHGLTFCMSIVIFNAITKAYFQNKYIYSIYIICILFSLPLLQSFVFLWSEGIFILLILITIYYLDIYIKKPSVPNLVLLIMLSILICMQRKSGIIITGAFALILFKYKPEPKGFLKALAYLFVSSGPFILWTYRRYLINGSATNQASLRPGMIWENLSQSADVVSSWLMPDEIPLVVRSIILIAGIITAVLIFRKYSFKSYDDNEKFTAFSIITFVTYSSSLWIIFLYLKVDEPIDDRLLSPVYLFFIFLAFIFLDKFLFFIRQNSVLKKIILVSVIMLPLYFIVRTGYHMRRWNQNGTGGYNTTIWAGNSVIKYLMDKKPKGVILSNNIYVLAYYLNFKASLSCSMKEMKEKIPEGCDFSVFFLSGYSHPLAKNDNFVIKPADTTKILYEGKEGIIMDKTGMFIQE